MNDPDFSVGRGDLLRSAHNSFLVEDILGKGDFGTVMSCRNTETGAMVAVKIIKNPNEVSILKKPETLDPDACGIVSWMGYFPHGPHNCLEFELLDSSLPEHTCQAEHNKLPLMQIRDKLKQVTTALVHLDVLGIIHGDLNPSNIMLSGQGLVKLIDFGSSCHVSEAIPGARLQSLCYRAPEIMLGLPFTGAIDMWSLGCMAGELLTGRKMYACHTEYDMWRYIYLTHRSLPDAMLDKGTRSNECFSKGSVWRIKTSQDYEKMVGCMWPLPDLLPFCSLEEVGQVGNVPGQAIPDSFLDLLKRMLELYPNQRITPRELLEHPFFHQESQKQLLGAAPVSL